MNNSQSIERFRQYFRAIDGFELSTGRRKAAQLADGLVSPKTTFHRDIRQIVPEFAGYGVLPRSQLREITQAYREFEQGRPSRPPRWSASNQIWQVIECSSKAFRCLQPKAAAKGAWEARRAGHVACPGFPPPDPLPVRKCARGPRTNYAAPSGAHRKMRGTECVHSPAPLIGCRRSAVGGRQSNRPNRVFVLDWTTRRTRRKGRNRSRFPPCR